MDDRATRIRTVDTGSETFYCGDVCVVCLFETKVANEGTYDCTLVFRFVHALFADSFGRRIEPEYIPPIFSTLQSIFPF